MQCGLGSQVSIARAIDRRDRDRSAPNSPDDAPAAGKHKVSHIKTVEHGGSVGVQRCFPATS